MSTDQQALFSAAEPYLGAACGELRRALPAARVDRVGADLGIVTGADVDAVAAACRGGPLVFVRHLAAVAATVASDDVAGLAAAARAVALTAGGPVALQVWATGPGTPRAEMTRAAVDAALTEVGVTTRRAGEDRVLGVCVTPATAYVCLTPVAVALADWPGGRVRLSRPPDQVSRAELKLEELFKVAPLPLPSGARAVDLGASPGGWTRVLRRRGYEVWAVDPGRLDERVAGDRGVHHVATTAGRFLAETDIAFDLLVNDMRMPPTASCAVVVDAAPRLRAGGLAVVTLKIAPRRAIPVVRNALAVLAPAYEAVVARQLFHNRNEVTVVARRR